MSTGGTLWPAAWHASDPARRLSSSHVIDQSCSLVHFRAGGSTAHPVGSVSILDRRHPNPLGLFEPPGKERQMPIHFRDLDVASQIEGVSSALIVPCTMCPAVTVAVRAQEPFLQILRSLFTSAPFDCYIKALQSRLADRGVRTEVFKSRLYHHWFMCMWTAARREKLRQRVSGHDAVIVLGCDSATETVRKTAEAAGCKVIEGMAVSGIMNARLRLRLPGSVSFEGCRIVPISGRTQQPNAAH